ncbi:pectin lyase-like protein [Thozetella sp. PMI_491]|nr:pectin lyase-like protein [Thozetella sp. PMI_491]
MRTLGLLLAAASAAHAAFWMEGVPHRGKASFNPDTSYQVFRNVKDFGAKGDGETDDTDAINLAISTGSRCGGNTTCAGSTTTPAVVYFPAGTYLISSSLIDYYYTQLIGDPTDLPVLKGSSTFNTSLGIGLIDSNPYGFQATNVFFTQVRNLVFDLTEVNGTAFGIHWPSSQATSIQNCVFKMSKGPQYEHTGIFIEEGSGGFMSDLVFLGGKYGAQFGNQQYTMRNLTFDGSDTAIWQLWDWGWTYKSLTIKNCDVGINMTAALVGSVSVLDSSFTNVNKAILTGRKPTNSTGQGSLVIENVHYSGVGTVLEGPGGVALLAGQEAGSKPDMGYAMGKVYTPYGPNPPFNGADPNSFPRPHRLLDGNGKIYERSKPQYESTPAWLFLSARDFGAHGDGVHDDTDALNSLFRSASKRYASGVVAFLDAGYYKVLDTIYVPPNIRVVGEGLAAVILGAGPKFADIESPYPVMKIGEPGCVGYVEMSDLIVSTQGATAGAVLIEYNLDTSRKNSTGPSGLWDVHVRVGGFAGSDLQVAQCEKTPDQAGLVRPECIAGYLSMHVTKSARNLYMENNWIWVADHDIENINSTQISVFVGRGLLIDSTAGGIWLVGTAVEHHTLYQYQLVQTRDVWMGQIQTETPYYQPSPPAPYPFVKMDEARWDPDFAYDCKGGHKFGNGTFSNITTLPGSPPCEMAWGLRILGSQNVVVFGGGLYSFFNNYNTSCSTFAAGEECQARIFTVQPTLPHYRPGWNDTAGANTTLDNIVAYNLNTVGTVAMATRQGVDVALWSDNYATFASTIAIFRY